MDDEMDRDSGLEDSPMEIESYDKPCTLHVSRQRLWKLTPEEQVETGPDSDRAGAYGKAEGGETVQSEG